MKTNDIDTSVESRDSVDWTCLETMTPDCVRALYNIPFQPTHHTNNSFGIYLPAWSSWLGEDLDSFFRQFQPELVGARPFLQPISGGYRQLDYQIDAFNLEANLDFEYAMALAYPQPVTDLQVGSKDHPGNLNILLAAFNEDYCDMLDADIDLISPGGGLDCGTVDPPSVISISWAWAESDFPREYLEAQCLEFLKLGLRGVTVVVSTGDAGPAKHPDGTCPDGGSFEPSWPSACPWVTAVGGTAVDSGDRGVGPDGTGTPDPSSDRIVAWRNQPSAGPERLRAGEEAYRRCLHNATRSSGGGFSNRFGAPSYQLEAVKSYLEEQESHLGSFSKRFNATGRGYPDVSAVGASVQVVTGGELKSVFGTSASAPIFASVIAKVNDARLRAGKRPVGFINPVLYSHQEMMNDVVDGANAGCGVEEAFRATDGWDAVTGLGSPDFKKMRDVFLGLP